MLKISYCLLGCLLLASCAITAPAPPRPVASRPAYLPARLPRRPPQHVLDSLASAASRRKVTY